MDKYDTRNRIRGSLIGGALGDGVEFKKRMRSYGAAKHRRATFERSNGTGKADA